MRPVVNEFIEDIQIANNAMKEGKTLKAAYWVGRATELADRFDDGDHSDLLEYSVDIYSLWVRLRMMCQQFDN